MMGWSFWDERWAFEEQHMIFDRKVGHTAQRNGVLAQESDYSNEHMEFHEPTHEMGHTKE